MRGVEIKGGAGPFEAAAVTAVIQHLLDSERQQAERLTARNRPTAWMVSARPRTPDDPPLLVPDHRGDPL